MHYFVILTCSGGFSSEQILTITSHFVGRYEKLLLVQEPHADGSLHVHAVFENSCKQTAGVTRIYERFYANVLHLPVVPRVTIVTRAVTELIGIFHYLTDPSKDGVRLATLGWTDTWITAQVKANLKKMPKKLLQGQSYSVEPRTAVDIVIQYAIRSNHPIIGKMSFMQCVAHMEKDGYRFHRVKPRWLYVEVMAMLGDLRPAVSHWDILLYGLE